MLRRFRPFANGTPSHDQLGIILARLDPVALQRCFVAWTAALTNASAEVIAIDGKTVRRSYQKKGAEEPIHVVSAFAARQRIIRRMIDKWLKAGAVEDGLLRHTTEGSPQGGVVSPCLSNIFLHYVLDEWFETEVKPRLRGECTLVRFADDALMAFDNIVDAKRVLSVLDDVETGGKSLTRDQSGGMA